MARAGPILAVYHCLHAIGCLCPHLLERYKTWCYRNTAREPPSRSYRSAGQLSDHLRHRPRHNWSISHGLRRLPTNYRYQKAHLIILGPIRDSWVSQAFLGQKAINPSLLTRSNDHVAKDDGGVLAAGTVDLFGASLARVPLVEI